MPGRWDMPAAWDGVVLVPTSWVHFASFIEIFLERQRVDTPDFTAYVRWVNYMSKTSCLNKIVNKDI